VAGGQSFVLERLTCIYQDLGHDECFAGHFAGPVAEPFIGHAADYRYCSSPSRTSNFNLMSRE
jgi:hypothetical protein